MVLRGNNVVLITALHTWQRDLCEIHLNSSAVQAPASLRSPLSPVEVSTTAASSTKRGARLPLGARAVLQPTHEAKPLYTV